jgi:hypothetical protein
MSDIKDVLLWKSTLSEDIKKLLSITIEPADFTKDQLVQAYVLLYPFIASEFVHRTDLIEWENTIKAEFDAKVEKLNAQIKAFNKSLITAIGLITIATPGASAMGSMQAVPDPALDTWSSKPDDFKFGESLITDTDSYSDITHRSINKPAEKYVAKISTPEVFNKTQKLVPFDAEANSFTTHDNKFANKA